MGFDKVFATLNGRPVVAHSLGTFERSDCITNIVLVGRDGQLSELKQLVREHRFGKVSRIIAGGARRQDSVNLGLKQLDPGTTYVAVHDAARPLVRQELIEEVFTAAQMHGGAACAVPVNDTLKRTDARGFVIGGVDRERLFAMQTPQIFRHDLLSRAYAVCFKRKLTITDEISAVEQLGERVVLVPNEKPNLKITYPSDLVLADLILRQRS